MCCCRRGRAEVSFRRGTRGAQYDGRRNRRKLVLRPRSDRRDEAVVTGASGRIGRGVCSALKAAGHRVIGLDINSSPDVIVCDLAAAADMANPAHATLNEACAGADVVLHLAAWPGPSAYPPPAVAAAGTAVAPLIGLEDTSPSHLLSDNLGATSAVCDAAVRGGARRVVFSSSAFAIGYSHACSGPQAFAPRYLPIDEAHGALPHETYGLSKLCGEHVLEAQQTAKSTSFVSPRFPNIIKSENWATLPWDPPTVDSPMTFLLGVRCGRRCHRRARTSGDATRRGFLRIARGIHYRCARYEIRRADDGPARYCRARRIGCSATPSNAGQRLTSRLFQGGRTPRVGARSWQQAQTCLRAPAPAQPPAYGLGARAAIAHAPTL